MKEESKKELEIVIFKTQAEFHKWLHKNYDTSPGIWIKMYKKATNIPSINHQEAILEGLCYGWIDGQSKGLDDKSWLQKFTPRRPRSIWSKINTEHVQRLIDEGKMQPAGMAQVEAAKADGRWQQAYDSPSTMEVPADFLKEISKNKKAEAFFKTLNKTNRFAIAFRLQTAKKPETRERRMKVLLEMMAEGKKIY